MKFLPKWRLFGDPLKVAKKILGPKYVLSVKDLAKVVGLRRAPSCPILNSEAALEWCAEENRRGEEWRLVPKLGVSFAEVRRLKPGEFCEASVWQTMPHWVTSTCKPGYRLINFKVSHRITTSPVPSSVGTIWFAPARVQTVAEALIGIRLTSKEQSLRLLLDKYHGGGDYQGITPIVGEYNEKGMLVYTLPTECMYDLFVLNQIGTIWCVAPEVQQKAP